MSPVAEPALAATALVRVLVIDDHRVFAELLALALDGGDGIECVAIAATAAEGLAKASAYDVEAIVLDVRLPDANGLDLVARLRAVRPDCRVIVLTAHPRADHAARAFEQGAVAFLAKDERLDDLLRAVRSARHGRTMLTKALPRPPHEDTGLTPRELDVLDRLAHGDSAIQIATTLHLSAHTVRDHIKAILAKLDARSQLDAVLRSIELGIVEPGPR